MVFRSKIDFWLLAVLALATVPMLAAAIAAARNGDAWVTHAVIFVVVAGLFAWLLTSTKYTVGEGMVLVQSGPFRWQIAAKDVTNIAPSRSPLSSPALSLDRLRIEYASGKSLLVSPRDKEAFIKALSAARGAA